MRAAARQLFLFSGIIIHYQYVKIIVVIDYLLPACILQTWPAVGKAARQNSEKTI
jgi:hypothetical protein